MAKKIMFWPDVYLEQGHWLPTVVWADGLTAQNHTVSYMGIRDCVAVVKPFGYTENPGAGDKGQFHVIFEDLYPLGYTRTSQSSINERWKPDHIFAIAAGALDALFIGSAKPDLLVSGYFTSLESLLIHYKYGIEVVTTTTYLRHPQDDPAIRATQNLMAFPHLVVRKLMRDVLGADFDPAMDIRDFVKPLENVHELVPCPKEFEFAHYLHGDRVHFVEPCITPAEPSPDEAAFWSRIPAGKSLIFATAGSQVQDYEKKAEHLFEEMISMMSTPQMDGYHLILGVGPKLAKRDWGLSPLYTVASWVPQRSILNDARLRVALIHGGLATIKECIYFDKPFVILPLGKDQLDNALRLRKTGVADMADADRATVSSLLDAVNMAISDPWMAARRSKMNAIFTAMENTQKPGLALLHSLLA